MSIDLTPKLRIYIPPHLPYIDLYTTYCVTEPHRRGLHRRAPCSITAQTNASKPKLERMLYYKDTKLRSRRRSRKGHIYIHSTKMPLTRAPVSVACNGAIISYRGGTPAPSHHPPLLKKPALRLCISPSLKEKEEKKKEI